MQNPWVRSSTRYDAHGADELADLSSSVAQVKFVHTVAAGYVTASMFVWE